MSNSSLLILIFLIFTFHYGSTLIALADIPKAFATSSIYIPIWFYFNEEQFAEYTAKEFTFQYGSTLILAMSIGNVLLDTFTFQYGSTLILRTFANKTNISLFTFQYGSTLIIFFEVF